MKAKTKRTAMRWFHIVTGSIIATYLYSPWHSIPEFQWLAKGVVMPLLILTGLWLWKGHLLLKALRRQKAFLIFLLFFLPGSALLAQSNFKGGSGSFDFGIQTMDVSPINDQLAGLGYPSFSDIFYTIGGSGAFYLNRIVLGGEGAFYGQGDQSNGQFEAELAGGHGLVSIGYLALARKGWLLFPSLAGGVSGTGFSLQATDREYSFGQVLAQPDQFPNQSVEFGQTSGLLRLAIQVEKFFAGIGTNRYGPKIGITAGYTFATTSSFRQEGVELAGSPSFSPSGFFVSLKVGGGFFGEGSGKK